MDSADFCCRKVRLNDRSRMTRKYRLLRPNASMEAAEKTEHPDRAGDMSRGVGAPRSLFSTCRYRILIAF